MDPRLDRFYLFFVLVFDFSNRKIQNSKITLCVCVRVGVRVGV